MNLSERENSSQIVKRSPTYIPQELVKEILMKMKAKDICKFITLSKYWLSTIPSKDFTNLYMIRSMSQPRVLFSIPPSRRDMNPPAFYSCSQENPPADHYRISCKSLNPKSWYEFSPPVHGLLSCVNDNDEVMIGNPGTCQFITLPKVKTSRNDIISFFGYVPNAGEYKFLCMTMLRDRFDSKDVESEEQQVFTLEVREKQWKMIECKHPHHVFKGTQGIYNDGVVYYQVLINRVNSLMCFKVASEKFSVTKLPKDDFMYLSNYGKKIAVTDWPLCYGEFDLWILEDASTKVWSYVSILVPNWSNLFNTKQMFKLKGTLGTGELIFVPCFSTSPYYLLCYDFQKNEVRKIWIEGIGSSKDVEVFLDHVESPMFLSQKTFIDDL